MKRLGHSRLCLVTFGTHFFFFFFKSGEGWDEVPKCICRRLRKLFFFLNGSFLSVSVCAWAKNVGMGRTFPLHQLSLCVMVFMLFCLSFEMREELEIMIFINFFVTIYSFSQGCFFIFLPFFTAPPPPFKKLLCPLVYNFGPF